MIIVKIWGGLGNQLFQYSFGKYLSAKLNAEVKYDIQTISNVNNFTSRSFELSLLNIKIAIASPGEINKTKYFKNKTLARFERKIVEKFPFLTSHYMVESKKAKPVEALYFKDDCYYEGYWQSYKYLTVNEFNLRNEISFKDPPKREITGISNQIESVQSISIHVRRGDYITIKKNSGFFSLCNMNYYERAILHFKELYSNAKYFIFTDDLVWCKENFIGSQFIFVTGNQPFEDMYLMSKCKHNIIANSTFSWWAAWLNNNPGKIVIAPKWWNKGINENIDELIPGNWLKIDQATGEYNL